ncbi:hypothetical protein HK101_000555 [Irineochytrium annulatum]|nr:hypothetical protein HK101_000555 [Irineochytrium annulatum]
MVATARIARIYVAGVLFAAAAAAQQGSSLILVLHHKLDQDDTTIVLGEIGISSVSASSLTVTAGQGVQWQSFVNTSIYVILEQSAPRACVPLGTASVTTGLGNRNSASLFFGAGTHYWYADLIASANGGWDLPPGQECKEGVLQGAVTVLPASTGTTQPSPSPAPSPTVSSSTATTTTTVPTAVPTTTHLSLPLSTTSTELGLPPLTTSTEPSSETAPSVFPTSTSSADSARPSSAPATGPIAGIVLAIVVVVVAVLAVVFVMRLRKRRRMMKPSKALECREEGMVVSLRYEPSADIKLSPPTREASMMITSPVHKWKEDVTVLVHDAKEDLAAMPVYSKEEDVAAAMPNAKADVTLPLDIANVEPVPPMRVGSVNAALHVARLQPAEDKRVSVLDPVVESSSDQAAPSGEAASPDVATWTTEDVARWLEDKLQLRPSVINAFRGTPQHRNVARKLQTDDSFSIRE